ncbi:MAG: MFS transporter [Deltaproteobacteria bacterium]|nr:MAG: MFS transporter [Deltaproteobacteria bacterium]
MNRWFRVAGGVSLNLCLGAAYVYSVFLAPLQREFGWTRSELSVAFTLSMVFIATGVLVGGRWQDRRGPAAVSLAGALLFSAGIFLSRYTDSLAWLYVCYGVVVGLGSGIGYTCPLSVGMKWFPERRGLVTGIMVMGYGAGGAVIAPLAGYLIQRFGWRDTFGILGAAFLAVTVAGSMFLRNPPEGWRPPGGTPATEGKGTARGGRDFLPREMVGTGAFRRMWVAYALGTAAGLMVIGHLAAFALGAGFSARDSALSVGMLSVGNGCGRIASGWMSDHIGRVRTLSLVMGATALLLFLAPGVSTVPLLFALVFLIGYCYGSQLAVFPSTTADYFGMRNLGNNYGLLLTAWGVAGIIGPMAGGWIFDATHGYAAAFRIAALLAVAAAVVVATVKAPPPGDSLPPKVRRVAAAVLLLLCAPALSATGETYPVPIPADSPASIDSPAAPPAVALTFSDNAGVVAPIDRNLRWKNAAVIGGVALAVGAYGAKHWWDVPSSFWTKREGWFGEDTYAGGADKLAHVFVTYAGTRALARVFEGLGNPPEKSLRLAGWTSLGVFTGVEVLDGFSSRWGFSYEDMVCNFAGVAFAILMESYPSVDAVLDFRLLYERSDDDRLRGKTSPAGDYSGQTYLLAFKVDGVPRLRNVPLVRYLEFLVGYGARGYEIQRDPHRQVYYGVGINLSRLLGDTLFRGDLKGGKVQGATDTLLELFEVPGTAALNDHRL